MRVAPGLVGTFHCLSSFFGQSSANQRKNPRPGGIGTRVWVQAFVTLNQGEYVEDRATGGSPPSITLRYGYYMQSAFTPMNNRQRFVAFLQQCAAQAFSVDDETSGADRET